ncbi:unnamed protein product, partial [Protopolystoma xenopodis]
RVFVGQARRLGCGVQPRRHSASIGSRCRSNGRDRFGATEPDQFSATPPSLSPSPPNSSTQAASLSFSSPTMPRHSSPSDATGWPLVEPSQLTSRTQESAVRSTLGVVINQSHRHSNHQLLPLLPSRPPVFIDSFVQLLLLRPATKSGGKHATATVEEAVFGTGTKDFIVAVYRSRVVRSTSDDPVYDTEFIHKSISLNQARALMLRLSVYIIQPENRERSWPLGEIDLGQLGQAGLSSDVEVGQCLSLTRPLSGLNIAQVSRERTTFNLNSNYSCHPFCNFVNE